MVTVHTPLAPPLERKPNTPSPGTDHSNIPSSKFGPASQASIFAVKVLGDDGSGAFSDIISGINAAVTHAVQSRKPSVVNLSLGGSASAAIDAAVNSGIRRGVHFTIGQFAFVVSEVINLILSFSAAGNDDVDASNDSPARVAAAITVGALKFSTRSSYFHNANANTPGALNADNSKADFSNFGRPLDGASPLTTPNSCPS